MFYKSREKIKTVIELSISLKNRIKKVNWTFIRKQETLLGRKKNYYALYVCKKKVLKSLNLVTGSTI